MREGLSADVVRDRLGYDPATGIFTWRKVLCNSVKVGDVAGSRKKDGYVRIKLFDVEYMAHRLAWLHMTGEWPQLNLDHKDTVRSNNRWNNLREATRAQNCQNRKRDRRNISGLKGVSWSSRFQKWNASITIDTKKKSLGFFDTPEAAHAVYVAAAAAHFGEFARTA